MRKEETKPSNFIIFVVFIGWVISTAATGVYVKAWLVEIPFPFFITFFQAFVGTILTYFYLALTRNLRKLSYPGVSNYELICVFGGHTLGTFLTNYANIGSSASFVNTLKACDPLFAVIGAKYVLHQEFSRLTYVSLVIIVIGIILACTTEFNFQFSGFLNAMISTGLFVLRAIYTKKILSKSKSLDGQNIFLHITVITTIIFAFFSVFECAHVLWEDNFDIYYDSFHLLFWASFSHWGYNILAFWLVMYLEPVTYSVGNSIKRLVTIFSSILYFRNPVSFLNGFSSIVAVGGVFLYSLEEEKRKVAQQQAII